MDVCPLRLSSVDCNELENAKKVTFKNVLDHMKHERKLIFGVVIKSAKSPKL